WIKESKYTVVLTGAGMSTESGIPDFRSKDGLWHKKKPPKLSSKKALVADYGGYVDSYKEGMKNRPNYKPHQGYEILAGWEDKGLVESIITQNVDDLHVAAGSRNLYRLHGSLFEFKCNDCSTPAIKDHFLDKIPCEVCGGRLRPTIVYFGESLPKEELYDSIEEMKKAELVLIIGTSLVVSPVKKFPQLTQGKTVYINNETKEDDFDLVFIGRAGEILEDVNKKLGAI